MDKSYVLQARLFAANYPDNFLETLSTFDNSRVTNLVALYATTCVL